MRDNTKNEISGSIEQIRALEDCIRATKHYTEGIRTIRQTHPIQGEDYASRSFSKHYEYYPDVEVSWDMPVGVAMDWIWKDVECITILFRFDYRYNEAKMYIKDCKETSERLCKIIPGFNNALATILKEDKQKRVVKICPPASIGSRTLLKQLHG